MKRVYDGQKLALCTITTDRMRAQVVVRDEEFIATLYTVYDASGDLALHKLSIYLRKLTYRTNEIR